MTRLFAALFALALTAGVMIESAEAARVGGGRSMGIQRSAPMQRQATPPAASQQQAQGQQAAPATAQQKPAGNRWLGPIAGLAAGLGLGWLLSQGGLGGMLGGLLMMALLAAVVFFAVRMFARRGEPARPMKLANWGGTENVSAPPPSAGRFEPAPTRQAVAPLQGPAGSQLQVPAGFDVEGFLKQAKRGFLQLQEANDRADLNELREVTTDQMFEALKGDVASRGARQQQTEIVALDASLLEVVTEGAMHWASVHFSGSVRESPHSAPESFDEVWHLQKPVNGQTGWLLAGIQQPS
jgi:predicted lipid-binding transport protein (Tim44 family)